MQTVTRRKLQLGEVRRLRMAMERRAETLEAGQEARGSLNDAQAGELDAARRAVAAADRFIGAADARGVSTGPDPDAALRRFAFGEWLRNEARGRGGKRELHAELRAALNVGTGAEGGFLVPPEFDSEVVITNAAFAPIEALSGYFESVSHGALTIAGATSLSTASQIAEAAAYPESEPTFAGYVENAYKFGHLVKLSDELFSSPAVDIVSLLAKLGGRSVQVAANAGFATGTGTGEPEGITNFTSALTAASTTAVTADELKQLFFSVAPGYRANACWIMADTTLEALTDLYFAAGSSGSARQVVRFPDQDDPEGAAPMILGRPVYSDQNMPAMAANNAAIVFASLEDGYLVRRLSTTVKVLTGLYEDTGEVGFRLDRRLDGRIIDPAAGRVLTMAA